MSNRQIAYSLLAISFIITIFFCIRIALDGYWIWGGPISYDKTGQVGDFIGGIIGTIFSAAGFYFLFLTFNEQRRSVNNQQIAFERERLESKFFDLVKMHRDNVSDLKFNSIEIQKRDYDFDKQQYLGRAVFKAILDQFVHCANELKQFISKESRVYNSDFRNEIANNPVVKRRGIDLLLLAKIDICFSIVFYGVGSEGKIILMKILCKRYKKKFVNEILRYISLKPRDNKEILLKWISLSRRSSRTVKLKLIDQIYNTRKGESVTLKSFDEKSKDEALVTNYHNDYKKYYGGHQYRLGHYYRHLFQLVKFINNNNDLNYQEKYDYVKILRAQLSTYEQALLFLNSLSSMGFVWEFSPEIRPDQTEIERRNFELITKYNLIKNLPGEEIFGTPFKHFYDEVQYEGEFKWRDNNGYV